MEYLLYACASAYSFFWKAGWLAGRQVGREVGRVDKQQSLNSTFASSKPSCVFSAKRSEWCLWSVCGNSAPDLERMEGRIEVSFPSPRFFFGFRVPNYLSRQLLYL